MKKPSPANVRQPSFAPLPVVELFGHVTLMEGYDLPTYQGAHALVHLRDSPGNTIAVLSTSLRIESLLQSALETGFLISFTGSLLANPPAPGGGTWSVPVYGNISAVVLYNSI